MKIKQLSPLAMALLLPLCSLFSHADLQESDLATSIQQDYDKRLGALFNHFHRNPELSFIEFKTAKKLASELRSSGFEVTEKVGGTGVVAILKNGDGPLVMMRGDMDALPIEEKSGLEYASTVTQTDPITGKQVPVMHACGHDVHITSLIGTARQMSARMDQWSGTLMLIGQPAEERIRGAKAMMDDNLWERFGQPDYALAFHVAAGLPAGLVNVQEGSPFAGSDSVDIIVHGIGTHGASPPCRQRSDPARQSDCCRPADTGIQRTGPQGTGRDYRRLLSRWQQTQYYSRSRPAAVDSAQHQSRHPRKAVKGNKTHCRKYGPCGWAARGQIARGDLLKIFDTTHG